MAFIIYLWNYYVLYVIIYYVHMYNLQSVLKIINNFLKGHFPYTPDITVILNKTVYSGGVKKWIPYLKSTESLFSPSEANQ